MKLKNMGKGTLVSEIELDFEYGNRKWRVEGLSGSYGSNLFLFDKESLDKVVEAALYTTGSKPVDIGPVWVYAARKIESYLQRGNRDQDSPSESDTIQPIVLR